MKQTFKYFWAHRKQNGFVLVEIALVAFLSFYTLDYMAIGFYDTYLCKPAGDFEQEHLLVATIAKDANYTSLPDSMSADDGRLQLFEREALRLNRAYEDLRDSVRALPRCNLPVSLPPWDIAIVAAFPVFSVLRPTPLVAVSPTQRISPLTNNSSRPWA